MGWLKAAWSVGSSVPTLLAGPYGILIRLGLLAAVAGGIFLYGYVKGGKHGEAQLEEFRAGVDKVHAEQLARDAERKRLSDALISEKDKQHEQDLADADAYWSAYAASLQHDAGLGSGLKPVPVVSKICNDPARDHELSGAYEAARQDLGRAVAEYRRGLAPLLGAAEVQTADLVNLQDIWARERTINGAP